MNKLTELSKLYRLYERKLKEYNRLDFADLINLVNKELETNEDFSLTVQEQYEYILVDEYQDTNRAQNRLLFNLIKYWRENPNITVVGDDNQAIYRFQGASVANIYEFINTFPQLKVITLRDNYRSNPIILKAAHHIQKHIQENVSKFINNIETELIPKAKYKPQKIQLIKTNTESVELLYISELIQKLHKRGVPYENIAVLVRRNSQINPIAQILDKSGIPYTKSIGMNVLENPVVLKIINILRFLQEPEIHRFIRILHYPVWGLSAQAVLRYTQILKEYYTQIQKGQIRLRDKSQQLSLENINDNSLKPEFDFILAEITLRKTELPPQDKRKIKKLIELLEEWYKLAHQLPPLRLVETILYTSQLLEYVLKRNTKYEDLAAINGLFANLKAVSKTMHFTLKDILELIDLSERFNIRITGEDPISTEKGVQILTVHAAKGLEFDYVIIPQFNDRVWNTRSRSNPVLPDLFYLPYPVDFRDSKVKAQLVQQRLKHINNPKLAAEIKRTYTEDDERRLFYVALTRAKRAVFITYAEYGMTNGKKREQQIAQFYYDIPEDLIKEKEHKVPEITDSIVVSFKPTDLEDFYISTADEEEYLNRLLTRFKFSPSALIAYLKDPKEFYLQYFLKVPSITVLPLAYGRAFHHALERYFIALKQGRKPDLNELLTYFKDALKNYQLTQQELQDLIKKAERELRIYYEQRLQAYHIPPLYVERTVESALHTYPLKGTIDRVELLDTDKGYVRIIDVKTSAPVSLKEILGYGTKEKLGGFGSEYLIQLYFYKLLFELNPMVNRNKKYTAVEGAIDFAKPRSKHTSTLAQITPILFEDDKLTEFKHLVLDVLNDIYTLKFLKTL